MINHDLARSHQLSPETIAKIEAMQDFRKTLGEQYKAGTISAGEYREDWEDNEYVLQELWGFPLDPNFHMFWEMEGCTCPNVDNRDTWGTPYHYYNYDCPIHGAKNG